MMSIQQALTRTFNNNIMIFWQNNVAAVEPFITLLTMTLKNYNFLKALN